ncbi:yumC protein [Pediococcus claussenii]|nr:yumC protein [Pediococcus claussenii]
MKRSMSLMQNEVYDITIVGAGPAGLFAGFYAGMRTAKTQIIESLDQVGGQVTTLYPEKTIYDVGGYAGIKGIDFISSLEKQVRLVDVEIKLSETVIDIFPEGDFYRIKTTEGETRTKAVILATGNGAFNPRRLAIDGLETIENKHLFYTLPKIETLVGKEVAVAGGGDSAIDIALMLEGVAKSVTIIHRRNEFRGMEHSVNQLLDSNVKVLTPYLINSVEKNHGQLSVGLKKVGEEVVEQYQYDDLIVNYGFISSNKVIKNWSLDVDQEHRMFVVNSLMQTNLKNVYAIGDGIEYDGKLRLIATAFGEGPMAVSQIMKALYPDKKGPLHSTAMFK